MIDLFDGMGTLEDALQSIGPAFTKPIVRETTSNTISLRKTPSSVSS
jgi:hypothetical protein